jgi:hypothetical protein
VRQVRRDGARGQALIETAVVIAVILSILMGVYSVGQFASDQNTAGTATRAGARVASELGNGGYNGLSITGCQLTAKDPCAVDRQIVQNVCQIAAAMPFVTSISEVDIYRVTIPPASGVIAEVDRYTSCAAGAGAVSAAYTLNLRIQTHPNETYIGVSLKYNYRSPVPLVPLTTTATVSTVTLLSPHFS